MLLRSEVWRAALLVGDGATGTNTDERHGVHSPEIDRFETKRLSSDERQHLQDTRSLSSWATKRIVIGTIVVTVVAAAGSVAAKSSGWTQALHIQALHVHTTEDGTTELFEGAAFKSHTDPCDKYVDLKVVSVEYSNLGHKGPNLTRPEGVSWWVVPNKHHGANVGHKELLIHGSARGVYKPFSPVLNGMQGKYGSINLQGGSEVNLTFTIHDAKSKKRVELPTFSLSFFDLGVDAKNGVPLQTVTLSNFLLFFRDERTEVNVSKHADGSTTFGGRACDADINYPINPMPIGTQRSRHAFSVVYNKASEVHCHLRAGSGRTPRLFKFAFGPSLLCSPATSDFRPPLPDLEWMPPLEVPLAAGPGEIFMRWLVQNGDSVRKGDEICSVRKLGGTVETHKAPCDGVVKKRQVSLQAGDELDARLSEKTLAVIIRFKIDKLKLPHGGTCAGVAQSGTFFVKYTVKVYDFIREGAVIAITHNEGGLPMKVRSTAQGSVLALQQQITDGDPVEIVPDRNLAVIGQLPALQVEAGMVPIVPPVGHFFARWHRKKGDFIEKGGRVCVVRNAKGGEISVLAPRNGMLRAMQHDLPREVTVDVAVQDRILATLGPLPPLEVLHGETPTYVPVGSNWLFDSWKVKLGTQVRKGDTIAMVQHVNGSRLSVPASKNGMVAVMQKHLHDGSNISEIVQDCNIAVIGKFVALVASEGQLSVEVSPDAIFKRWCVRPGAFVAEGSAVAEVIFADTARGSERKLAQGAHPVTIFSPGAGVVVKLQPLLSGESISAQQHGRTIALLGPHQPWWASWFAWVCIALAGTFGLLVLWRRRSKACNRDKVGKRDLALIPCTAPRPESNLSSTVLTRAGEADSQMLVTPQMATETAEENPNDEEPKGVRLNFVDGDDVHTVYAQYKPLGIIHESSQPAVVGGFFCNSYAAALGVQQGWRLQQVNHEVLDDSVSVWALEELLQSHFAELSAWPLNLAFKPPAERDGGSITTVCTFTEQPLGFLLANRVPKINKVCAGSPADTLGIKEGWILVSVGEQVVSPDRNTKETVSMLREAVALLPDSGAKFAPAPWRLWGSPSKF